MKQNETGNPAETGETSSQGKAMETTRSGIKENYKIILVVLLVLVIVVTGSFYQVNKIRSVEKATQSLYENVTARNDTFSTTINNLNNEIEKLRLQLEKSVKYFL